MIISVTRLRGIGEITAQEIAGDAVAGEADVEAVASYDAVLVAKIVIGQHLGRSLVEEAGDVCEV